MSKIIYSPTILMLILPTLTFIALEEKDAFNFFPVLCSSKVNELSGKRLIHSSLTT